MIEQMRSRITIKTPTFSKDAGGGESVTYSTGYSIWAKADNRSGSAGYQDGQRQVSYDYRFKVRYYASAVITTDQVVIYGSKTLRINSVENDKEGNLEFCYLNCTVHGGT